MSSSQTTKGTRRYRYLCAARAQKRGWQTCPAPSLPAGPIEDLVVEQITRLAPRGGVDAFRAVWQGLPLAEQACLLERLVERSTTTPHSRPSRSPSVPLPAGGGGKSSPDRGDG